MTASDDDQMIRDLLAGLRVDAPMPESVAGRLDNVLADLVAERDDDRRTDRSPREDDSASDQSRVRRVPRLVLAAAATVVVSGIGFGVLQDQFGSLAGSSEDSAASTASTASSAEVVSSQDSLEDYAGVPSRSSIESLAGAAVGPVDPVVISSQGFLPEVVSVLAKQSASYDSSLNLAPKSLPADRTVIAPTFSCGPADWNADVVLPAIYDGRESVLGFSRAEDGTQVRVFDCATARVLRSASVAD